MILDICLVCFFLVFCFICVFLRLLMCIILLFLFLLRLWSLILLLFLLRICILRLSDCNFFIRIWNDFGIFGFGIGLFFVIVL